MAQPRVKWSPTSQQDKLIDVTLDSGLRRSITAICKKANVPRRTFYNWLRDDKGFREYWNGLHLEMIAHHLPGVVSAQVYQALKGNVSAARLLAEIAGQLKTRMEVTGKDGAPLELTGAKEKLVRRIAELATRGAAGKSLK